MGKRPTQEQVATSPAGWRKPEPKVLKLGKGNRVIDVGLDVEMSHQLGRSVTVAEANLIRQEAAEEDHGEA